MTSEFNRYAAKGNEILNRISEELKVSRDSAFLILCAVLHTTRNHLSMEESLKLLSHLPMALKGIYVNNWNPFHSANRIYHVKQLLDEVRGYDKKFQWDDFGNDETAIKKIKTVYKILRSYMLPGDTQDIMYTMPSDLNEFIWDGAWREPKYFY
jgi:uncharacterized protein (DUF2267 family)